MSASESMRAPAQQLASGVDVAVVEVLSVADGVVPEVLRRDAPERAAVAAEEAAHLGACLVEDVPERAAAVAPEQGGLVLAHLEATREGGLPGHHPTEPPLPPLPHRARRRQRLDRRHRPRAPERRGRRRGQRLEAQ
uniref:Uncharacterized protein n=1 Tax=Triticum urartu TaxID=4572 RepID=A0A8R7V682_TRIUA